MDTLCFSLLPLGEGALKGRMRVQPKPRNPPQSLRDYASPPARGLNLMLARDLSGFLYPFGRKML